MSLLGIVYVYYACMSSQERYMLHILTVCSSKKIDVLI